MSREIKKQSLLHSLRGETETEVSNLGEPEKMEQYREIWDSLELPPAASPTPFTAQRWLAEWQDSEEPVSHWEGITGWSRVAAATALTTGLVLGIGIGASLGGEELTPATSEILLADSWLDQEVATESSTLTESYWQLVTEEQEVP